MRTKTDRSTTQSLNEIDGYLELGMEGEALEIVRQTLSKSAISADEFHNCVFALLQSEQLEQWTKTVENAYRKVTDSTDDRVRSSMLNFYFSVNELKKAFLFFPRSSTKFFDAWTMMHVCLELARLDEAKKVARYCRGVLGSANDDFTKASMADALAAYHLGIGDPEGALKLWNETPDEPAFQRQRLTGIVKARLMQALQAAGDGLKIVAQSKGESDLTAELQMPGNDAAIMEEARSELEDLRRGIEQVLNR